MFWSDTVGITLTATTCTRIICMVRILCSCQPLTVLTALTSSAAISRQLTSSVANADVIGMWSGDVSSPWDMAVELLWRVAYKPTISCVTYREHCVTYREHCVTYREHCVTYREHCVTYREHCVTFREHCVTYREHSVTYREHCVTYREHSCVTYREHCVTYREHCITYREHVRKWLGI